MSESSSGSGSLVPRDSLERMAKILGVADPATKDQLRERVEAAFREYGDDLESRPPSPRQLNKTFGRLHSLTLELQAVFQQLCPDERRRIDEASSDVDPGGLLRASLDTTGALAALNRIRTSIEAACGMLPPQRRGPPPDYPRWALVVNLALIYAETKPSIQKGDRLVPQFPTRRYNP